MLRLIHEMFVGHVKEVKDQTVGYTVYFGMVLVMSFIYFLGFSVPLLVYALIKGLPITLAGFGCVGVPALGLGATSVDLYIDRLQQQVRNDTIRGKDLDGKVEGE